MGYCSNCGHFTLIGHLKDNNGRCIRQDELALVEKLNKKWKIPLDKIIKQDRQAEVGVIRDNLT